MLNIAKLECIVFLFYFLICLLSTQLTSPARSNILGNQEVADSIPKKVFFRRVVVVVVSCQVESTWMGFWVLGFLGFLGTRSAVVAHDALSRDQSKRL